MRIMHLTVAALLAGGALPAAAQSGIAEHEDDHAIVALAPSIDWQSAPPSLPPGAQVAVLEGDPGQPGPFTMRLRMPAGYRIPPHFHPSDERVTVVSGTFWVGMGEAFDRSAGVELPAGAYAALKPEVAHYAWTTEETVIQLNNIGPWTLTYVDAADDPRNGRPAR